MGEVSTENGLSQKGLCDTQRPNIHIEVGKEDGFKSEESKVHEPLQGRKRLSVLMESVSNRVGGD